MINDDEANSSYTTEQKLNEMILDLLWQACGQDEDGLLDTIGISVYEETANYLAQIGLLEKKNDRIYFLARKKDLKSVINGGKI